MKRTITTFLPAAGLLCGAAPLRAQAPRIGLPEVIDVGPLRFADVGQYFCALTQTPGTAYNLTGATQNAFSATASAMWVLYDNATTGDPRRIYIDHAKIIFATAGTAGTAFHVATATDTGNRFSSGGTAQTIVNVNSAVTRTSIAVVNAGAITATAATGAVKYVGRATVSTAIPAANETYALNFGSVEDNTPVNKMATLPPVVIGPGQSAVIYAWLPSQSAAPTGELTLCWRER
jgi:hypothetical protein